MHLPTCLAAFANLLAFLQSVLATPDLGYWDVNITSARSAQGYEAQFAWVIYSGSRERTIYDEWSHNPQTGNVTSLRNTNKFSISVYGVCGAGSAATIKQRVDIAGREYWIAGKTGFNFKINQITGRGGTASFRVNATLDDGAVDVCGRPLNGE